MSTRSRLRRDESVLRRILRHRLAQIGLFLLLLLVVAAFRAPYISHLDPTIDLGGTRAITGEPFAPGQRIADSKFASQTFVLGADTLGRDVWTRVLYGARLSLEVGFFACVARPVHHQPAPARRAHGQKRSSA